MKNLYPILMLKVGLTGKLTKTPMMDWGPSQSDLKPTTLTFYFAHYCFVGCAKWVYICNISRLSSKTIIWFRISINSHELKPTDTKEKICKHLKISCKTDCCHYCGVYMGLTYEIFAEHLRWGLGVCGVTTPILGGTRDLQTDRLKTNENSTLNVWPSFPTFSNSSFVIVCMPVTL